MLLTADRILFATKPGAIWDKLTGAPAGRPGNLLLALGYERAARVHAEANLDFAPAVIASLAKELLTIEAAGDRARAESMLSKYSKMPAELSAALAKTTDIPVDVEPVYALH